MRKLRGEGFDTVIAVLLYKLVDPCVIATIEDGVLAGE
jgi:hypothetical protein